MAKTKPERATSDEDMMSGVKTGGVAKSSQSSKSKSKDIAKATAAKVDKAATKTKKMLKPNSDSDSENDSDDSSDGTSASSESSGSDSETEAKPKANGHSKANGKPVKAKDESGSESSEDDDGSDSSSDESDSGDEAPPVKTSAAKTEGAAAQKENNDEGSSSDSSASSADGKGASGKKAAAKMQHSERKGSHDSSDSSDGSDSEASEDEEEAAPKKRKPEPEINPERKRVKMDAGPESEPKGKNLFVGNLPWSVDEAGLGGLFEEYGELAAVRLITDRDSGRSKGYGYVEFVNADDAAKALDAWAGQALEGRNLNVDFAVPRKENPNRQQDRARAYGDEISEPSATLFVGNISFDADEQMVTDAFAEHAALKSVRLPTDVNSGALRGFGYVEFYSIDDATMAFNSMQGAEIAGRRLRLDYAQERAGNNGPPRGGRGGFGDRGGRGDRGGGFRGGRGGFGDRGGRGGRGGFGDRGGRGRGGPRGGGRGGSTNRGGMGDFAGKKVTF